MATAPTRATLWLIAAVQGALVLSGKAYAATGNGLKADAWKPLCKTATELGTIPNSLYNILGYALDTATTNMRQALRARIYWEMEADSTDVTAPLLPATYYGTAAADSFSNIRSSGLKALITAQRDTRIYGSRIRRHEQRLPAASFHSNARGRVHQNQTTEPSRTSWNKMNYKNEPEIRTPNCSRLRSPQRPYTIS
ncbi:Trypanosome variant surface glycoprotein (A-type) [Trypanosoma brucei equiperdum]|uniref:Trypanosome variant surface glycoprotein (A-type) n=1 Tax=Trypanosoma brucei equiperdum TaxID=630700 RepID=A0A3L6LCN9_9TRYP|nr:Trypanosome variant surface glycoprotein (A-type) [Trypanosoma brucei equiperdum]